MHLKTVVVENFRGFSKLKVDLDSTTILIGENNTGKTSVLDALRLCLSRALSRKGNPFEDHDYHLASDKMRPADSDQLMITLDFAESKKDEWPPEVIQAMAPPFHSIDCLCETKKNCGWSIPSTSLRAGFCVLCKCGGQTACTAGFGAQSRPSNHQIVFPMQKQHCPPCQPRN